MNGDARNYADLTLIIIFFHYHKVANCQPKKPINKDSSPLQIRPIVELTALPHRSNGKKSRNKNLQNGFNRMGLINFFRHYYTALRCSHLSKDRLSEVQKRRFRRLLRHAVQ